MGMSDQTILTMADYMLTKASTIRETAKQFAISKSYTYLLLTKYLVRINHSIYSEVQVLLEFNKAVRHLRGGASTQRKYKEAKLNGTTPLPRRRRGLSYKV